MQCCVSSGLSRVSQHCSRLNAVVATFYVDPWLHSTGTVIYNRIIYEVNCENSDVHGRNLNTNMSTPCSLYHQLVQLFTHQVPTQFHRSTVWPSYDTTVCKKPLVMLLCATFKWQMFWFHRGSLHPRAHFWGLVLRMWVDQMWFLSVSEFAEYKTSSSTWEC